MNQIVDTAQESIVFHPESLYFVPMGGCGEIGMNANFYGHQGKWIMVDCGVIFSRIPDALLMPNIQPLLDIIPKVEALVLTHAHEDHLGAVAHLWHLIKCPVYATPFTAYLLREKLKEARVEAPVIEIPLGGTFVVGPFDMKFISLTHSIPEPNAVAITTSAGIILHTGDWKLDPNPVLGAHVDFESLKAVGNTNNVLAVVCDSTNIFETGNSGSEIDVQQSLMETIAQCTTGMIVVACFASNAARLQSIYEAAVANGRKVLLVGRSLLRIRDAAVKTGYFSEDMAFVSPHEVQDIPREELLIISTGSQAEPKAALTRMVSGEHPSVKLAEGDSVIFSSRVIPGNEEGITNLKNQLVRWGIALYDDKSLHVSGHPYQEELKTMYALARPKIAVPVHGDDRHIIAHAKFATKELGIPAAITPHNGEIYQLAPKLEYVGYLETDRLMSDGNQLLCVHGHVMQERWALLNSGIVVITIVASRKWQRVMSTHVISHGVLKTDNRGAWEPKIRNIVKKALPEKITPESRGFEAVIIRQVESYFHNAFRKKPVVRAEIQWT